MNRKMLVILAAGTAVLAVVALWLSAGRQAVESRDEGMALAPGLLERINEVTAVTVTDAAGGATSTLRLEDGTWAVVERGGYPATLTDLRRGLIAIAEARLVEAKTANPEFYARLGVQDPESEDATSLKVVVELPDTTHEFVVGDLASRGQTATYVRRAGEAQTWAATGNLRLEGDPAGWLERAVIDLPTQSVRRVEIAHPDGDRVVIEKTEPGLPNFDVGGVPEGRELLSPSAGNSIAGALASLRLEDVVPADAFAAGAESPIVSTFESFDGRRVEVRSWLIDDVRHVALDLAFDPSLVPDPEPAPAEAEDDAEDGASVVEAVSEAAVAEAAERLRGWVFAIPSYKYSNLTKRLEDLLKPVEAGEVEPEPASS